MAATRVESSGSDFHPDMDALIIDELQLKEGGRQIKYVFTLNRDL